MMPNSSPRPLAFSLTLALISALLIVSIVIAQEMNNVYLPVVMRQPTPTPTVTSTPTVTPTPTRTPTTGSPNDITGTLALCNPGKTVYGLNESVCVIETIRNNGNGVVTYGVLGVNAQRVATGATHFQTSWSGNLSIGPQCTGPTDTCGGPWQDNIRGFDDTPGFKIAGQYRLTLAVCYSNFSTCTGGGSADWRNYTTLTITVQ